MIPRICPAQVARAGRPRSIRRPNPAQKCSYYASVARHRGGPSPASHIHGLDQTAPAPRRYLSSGVALLQQQQQQQQQSNSTTPAQQPGEATPPPGDAPSNPRPQPRRSRLRANLIFLGLGALLALPLNMLLRPAAPPEPGTPADAERTAALHARAAALPLVRALEADPRWTSWAAYGSFGPSRPPGSSPLSSSSNPSSSPDSPSPSTSTSTPPLPPTEPPLPQTTTRPDRLTTGPLGGSRGIGGYQRIFHNQSTGEVINVVHFGSAACGWPGVVHGGALATILDESLGRCAILAMPSGTGVTARLELRYLRPALAETLYAVRCEPVPEEELDEAERGKRDRKVWCRAVLAPAAGGPPCVEARGLFVVPKGIKLQRLGDQF